MISYPTMRFNRKSDPRIGNNAIYEREILCLRKSQEKVLGIDMLTKLSAKPLSNH
jgi:hypothetical protein